MEKFRVLGLDAVIAAEESLGIFPDNWDSLRVLTAMRTQWRYVPCGMGGVLATGLDYSALPEVWKRAGIPKKRRNTIFRDLMVMEAEAISVMNEKR